MSEVDEARLSAFVWCRNLLRDWDPQPEPLCTPASSTATTRPKLSATGLPIVSNTLDDSGRPLANRSMATPGTPVGGDPCCPAGRRDAASPSRVCR